MLARGKSRLFLGTWGPLGGSWEPKGTIPMQGTPRLPPQEIAGPNSRPYYGKPMVNSPLRPYLFVSSWRVTEPYVPGSLVSIVILIGQCLIHAASYSVVCRHRQGPLASFGVCVRVRIHCPPCRRTVTCSLDQERF